MTEQFQLFDELAPADFAALRGDIQTRGVLVPVLYDQEGNLLDGHHRERIGRELGIPVPTWQVECRNDDERRAVVRAVNIYRRHLTPEQRAEHIASLRGEGWSIRQIANVAKVGVATVHRDLARVPDGTPEPTRITGRDGKSYAPRSTAERLAPMMSSESVEWYTPQHVLDLVEQALGAIDLDPCADPDKRVRAGQHFTIEDDGLSQGWRGRVYMNPPYGGVIAEWVEKLSTEYEYGNVTEAIALVPARTDTAWWRRLPATHACFVSGRLRFSGADPAPFPSAALYLCKRSSEFAAAFVDLGDVWERWT